MIDRKNVPEKKKICKITLRSLLSERAKAQKNAPSLAICFIKKKEKLKEKKKDKKLNKDNLETAEKTNFEVKFKFGVTILDILRSE